METQRWRETEIQRFRNTKWYRVKDTKVKRCRQGKIETKTWRQSKAYLLTQIARSIQDRNLGTQIQTQTEWSRRQRKKTKKEKYIDA